MAHTATKAAIEIARELGGVVRFRNDSVYVEFNRSGIEVADLIREHGFLISQHTADKKKIILHHAH